ncbi:MAG: hypothetical protein H7224_10600 [Polaromonas sp.]|nr:hypothetical protein [Polaromonas sp.]
MFSLFNRAQRAIASSTQAARHGALAQNAVDGVAHQLLERAEAGAGRDPLRAQELRNAARAYLSVVR